MVVPDRPPIYERGLKRPKPPSPPPQVKSPNKGTVNIDNLAKPIKVSEKAEIVREKEKAEMEKKAKIDRERRMNRQKKLQEDISKAKEERGLKMQEREARKSEERAKDRAREAARVEKERKTREELSLIHI